jgi:two-component system, cell cycle response regulator DivK
MDINMPEMNGYDATRTIKNLRKDIPVVIQTALNAADEEEESRLSGADDFISKPIDLKSFLRKIEKYIDE